MADRRIVSRYGGTCRKCGKSVASGETVYWNKGRGISHISCVDSNPKPTDNKPNQTDDSGLPLFQETWGELKAAFLTALENPSKVFKRAGNVRNYNSLKRQTWEGNPRWTGCTIADMKDWLANGFQSDSFLNIGEMIEARPRRRIKYSEEGEFQYDLMRSGFDYPFLEWEKRERKPGLRLDIPYTFVCMTGATLIAEFARWLAKVTYTLETEGYDLEIGIRFDSESVGPRHPKQAIRIVVKEANQAQDYAQWSALFSPGGWRMLGFTALIQAADDIGCDSDSGLGYGLNRNVHSWGMDFNSDSRTLKLQVPWSPRDFPAEMMDELLKQALAN